MSRSDDFASLVMGMVPEEPKAFEPYVRHDPDGDCIEFIALPHAYRGERIDERVTALYSVENGELMGSLVKGVSKLLERNPGWLIELDDGKFRLSQLIRAAEASKENSTEPRRLTYKKLASLAEEHQIQAELAAH
ncbi:MAG: hypothetical protein M9894_30800 [Planctomycetes bacterium]|nr:hypothetical protein [Planctomycetota bacterium]